MYCCLCRCGGKEGVVCAPCSSKALGAKRAALTRKRASIAKLRAQWLTSLAGASAPLARGGTSSATLSELEHDLEAVRKSLRVARSRLCAERVAEAERRMALEERRAQLVRRRENLAARRTQLDLGTGNCGGSAAFAGPVLHGLRWHLQQTLDTLAALQRRRARQLLDLMRVKVGAMLPSIGGLPMPRISDCQLLPANVVAAAIGYTVLLVDLLARSCFATQLPFALSFNGSRSLVCSRRDTALLVLAPDSSTSFKRAIRLLQCDAMHLLRCTRASVPSSGSVDCEVLLSVLDSVASFATAPPCAPLTQQQRSPWASTPMDASDELELDDADSADEDAWDLVEKPLPPPPCSGAPEVDLWLNTSVH